MLETWGERPDYGSRYESYVMMGRFNRGQKDLIHTAE